VFRWGIGAAGHHMLQGTNSSYCSALVSMGLHLDVVSMFKLSLVFHQNVWNKIKVISLQHFVLKVNF
jgi:hypothetical protein